MTSSTPVWGEALVFAESYRRLLAPETLLLFELVDFAAALSRKEARKVDECKNVYPLRASFIPFSWLLGHTQEWRSLCSSRPVGISSSGQAIPFPTCVVSCGSMSWIRQQVHTN